MPKLIIQVPCYNEAACIGATLSDLPRSLPGIREIEWLIIDDGSTDGTAEVAHAHGADHVLRLPAHVGLARAFQAGLRAALALGADYIINTDADNQYAASGIPDLLEPLLEGKADIVIGERQIGDIPHFSPLKKAMQKLGSKIVSMAARTRVPDATSGFRAFTREVAGQLVLVNEYTYTLEMIIQAGHSGLAIASVPIRVQPPTRPSRLMRSTTEYVLRSSYTILRLCVHYAPLRFFGMLGSIAFLPGAALLARCAAAAYAGRPFALSTLVLGCWFVLLATLAWLTGLCADLVAVNRRHAQDSRRQLQEFHTLLRSMLPPENEQLALHTRYLTPRAGSGPRVVTPRIR